MHRDIELQNVIITGDDRIKLLDFGVAKASKKSELQAIVGQPYYMAPEVLEGRCGPKADIWSLGVLLYAILSGFLPF